MLFVNESARVSNTPGEAQTAHFPRRCLARVHILQRRHKLHGRFASAATHRLAHARRQRNPVVRFGRTALRPGIQQLTQHFCFAAHMQIATYRSARPGRVPFQLACATSPTSAEASRSFASESSARACIAASNRRSLSQRMNLFGRRMFRRMLEKRLNLRMSFRLCPGRTPYLAVIRF